MHRHAPHHRFTDTFRATGHPGYLGIGPVLIPARSCRGLQVMCCLATCYGERPATLREIAHASGIFGELIGPLVHELGEAELVFRVLGASGAYALTRSPHEITVGEIVRALEKRTKPREGQDESHPTDRIWSLLDEVVDQTLDGITLGSLTPFDGVPFPARRTREGDISCFGA